MKAMIGFAVVGTVLVWFAPPAEGAGQGCCERPGGGCYSSPGGAGLHCVVGDTAYDNSVCVGNVTAGTCRSKSASPVPAVSTWGMAVLVLVLMSSLTVRARRD